MSRTSRALGALGEARAAAHLRRRGYRVIAQNARAGGVEIDLIARRGGTLIFVEVKTRRSRAHGPPEASVDSRKQARLVRGAAAWLHESGARARRMRFDVIVCEVGEDSRWELRHLEAAFDAGGGG